MNCPHYFHYPPIETYSHVEVEAMIEAVEFLRLPVKNNMTLAEVDQLIKEASF